MWISKRLYSKSPCNQEQTRSAFTKREYCPKLVCPVVWLNLGGKVLSNYWYRKRNFNNFEEQELRVMVKTADIARKYVENCAYVSTVCHNPFGFVEND